MIQLLFADGFIENFTGFRTLSITGRVGSGKTLLSVALARWLYDHGLVDGVFANFPIEESFIPHTDTVVRSAVILDEAWFMPGVDARKTSSQYSMYGAFARKIDSYWIFPGIFAADKRLRQISCYRESDLWLLGVWWFKWIDFLGTKGNFLVRGYEDCFNQYDTKFIPADDGGIRDDLMHVIGDSQGSTRRVFTSGGKRYAEMFIGGRAVGGVIGGNGDGRGSGGQ